MPRPGLYDRFFGSRGPAEKERAMHPSLSGGDVRSFKQRFMEKLPFTKARAYREAEDERYTDNPKWTWSGSAATGFNISRFPDESGNIPKSAIRSLVLSPRLLDKSRPGLLNSMRGQRWKVAEPYISRNPILASQYAIRVLGTRWPEAEATIATDPLASVLYTYYILKTRWPDVERSIAADKTVSSSLKQGGLARVYNAIVTSGFKPRKDIEIILQDLIDQRM